MFDSKTFLFLFFVFSFACVTKTLATVTILSGNFNETNEKKPHSYTTGQFYYKFDDASSKNSRLRFDYDLADSKHVYNLYDFNVSALYSMCPGTCSAESTTELPSPWWYVSSNYTKTKESEGSYFWYTAKSPVSNVKRILMTDATTPSSTSLKAVEFSDGRVVRLSSIQVNKIPASDAHFSPISGVTCPTPTCSMFTDIVFVLDYSGSVDYIEWGQQSNFVIKVMESFSFGDNAAAAACVQFCGPSCGRSPRWVSIPGCRWSHAATDYDYSTCSSYYYTEDRTAKVLAGASSPSGLTVSTNRDDLISIMSKTRYPSGQTCQALGLELAMKVFDRSPRAQYNIKPERIVIAVTDGDDYCPNRTRAAAKKLREEYGALFMGVGVGLDCEYDKNFIRELVSTVGTEKMYFDVKEGYSKIKEYADKLFTPLCEKYHSECGPECKGFCGCGECFCPSCEVTGGGCVDYKCVAKDGTSHGCVLSSVKTCPVNDTCTQHVCVDEKGVGTCQEVHTCDDVAKKNPGTCRTVKCDNGSCSVSLNDNICKKLTTNCEIWECAPEGAKADDLETGCRIVTNRTQDCIDSNRGECFETLCDINDPDGKCIEKDLCEALNTPCKYYTCEKDESNVKRDSYICVNHTVLNRPNDTKCKIYDCNDQTGWYVSYEKTPEVCGNESGNSTCKSFECIDEIGCVEHVIEDCNIQCDAQMPTCVQEAAENSTLQACYVGYCKVKSDGSGGTVPYCLSNVTDCTKSKVADEARALNTAEPEPGQQRVCFTLSCKFGKCGLEQVPRPGEDNKCFEYICVEDGTGGWDWAIRKTEANQKCISDPCYERTCVNSTGCVPVEVCESYTTPCRTYTCVRDKEQKPVRCDEKNELIVDQCRREICVNNTKQYDYFDVMEVCGFGGENHSDHCLIPFCNSSGLCDYRDKINPNEDPCQIPHCNPENGNFTYTPKCDDGKYCTENKCTVDGECRFVAINCYLEVNMTGYPCFRAECVEQESSYRCMRRLKPGVFIDVCGNCVRDSAEAASSESSTEMTTCTDAPAEPLLKEGLAAASIAMIILGAILIGGVITTSSVLGTKALLERAHAAEGQSAHSNPLFEGNSAEMTNPTFTEVDEA